MSKNILVIGGTGAIGAMLVEQLLKAGHAVAIASRGHTRDGFGAQVRRIHVDRHHRAAMQAAFAHVSFDVVIDLLNRSPLDAQIALDVFKGKTKRYVMASSIAVYRQQIGCRNEPFDEAALDLSREAIDWQRDWLEPVDARENFAPGLRQAEAVMQGDGGLPAVSVRLAHVLGDTPSPHDPLAYYVGLVQSDQALLYANGKATTSFIDVASAASFLHWSAMQAFTGPVNAASGGQLSALGLHRRVGDVLGMPARALPLSTQGNLSPFDLPHPLLLDTERAAQLGYRFNRLDGWLDLLIHQYQPDLVSAPGDVPEQEAATAQVPAELLSACKPHRPSLQTSLSAAR
ncbi:SDR family oxidoreductase [Pseudoduganella ginsengisoli]|nr:NAD-dependent epimerase/dehydratase family protein [Pseudoduganella ginsengisoli]